MTSFLIEPKSYESYEQRISTEPASTQICKKYAISNFEKLEFSPVTANRYLKKMYSSIGKLQRIKTKTEYYIIMKG